MNKKLSCNLSIIQDPFKKGTYIVTLRGYHSEDNLIATDRDTFKKFMENLEEMLSNPNRDLI